MDRFLARLSQALQKNKTDALRSRDLGRIFGVGDLINERYRLDAEIGRGGMGIVYRAHDISDNRDVAIKLIDMNTMNALALQQFLREAEITAQLHHPHIVAVYETGALDTGTRQPSPFIVMELVQGSPLSEIHAFTYARIVDVAKQICDALQYVHDQGFVYRDLKPGNVILVKHGFRYSVKLLDFGLARSRGESDLSAESNRAGTVFYLAPELIVGGSPDIPSDLYALGATMYEMITGHVPFSNLDERNVLSQHLEERVSPPSHSRGDVPPGLESIVQRLLEKNPVDRFASAQEVRSALEQVTRGSESGTRGNLPSTDSAGREREIAQIVWLFESNQLVTLLDEDETLALATGAHLIDQLIDGVWLVQLDLVGEPSMVLQAVASVLGVRETPTRSLALALIESLREKNLLLLLNRCGHLRAACAQLAETILRSCPEVYILATSYQPLNIPAEKCFRGVGATNSSEG